MSKIYTSADQLIGKTPLLELTHIEKKYGLKAKILAKLEYFNPAGSVKDRAAQCDDRRRRGGRGPRRTRSVIIEPTSGNTGIGLSCHRRRAGLPHHHRHARDHVRGAAQADARLRGGAGAHRGRQGHEGRHRQRPSELAAEIPNSVHPRAVRPIRPTRPCTSAPPARRSGRTPTARWTSSWPAWAPAARIIGRGRLSEGAEPGHPGGGRGTGRISACSPTGRAGAHKIQGIGAGLRARDVLDTAIYDEVIAHRRRGGLRGRAGARLPMTDVLVGISSGAAVWPRRRSWRAGPRTRARPSSSSCPTPATAICPPRCSRKKQTVGFRQTTESRINNKISSSLQPEAHQINGFRALLWAGRAFTLAIRSVFFMKVLVAMSGGVDSSVAAKLLRDAGCECVGCTMKLFQNEDAGISRGHTCCALDDVEDAQRGVAAGHGALRVQFLRRFPPEGHRPLRRGVSEWPNAGIPASTATAS